LKKSTTSEYLAFLSAKYELDPDEFFCALNRAGESEKSTCGKLSIERRGETHEKIMFMILTNSTVVAQLSIFKEFLSDKGHPIRDCMQTDNIRRYLAKKARSSLEFPIRDLQRGMTRVHLKAKVLEISKTSVVYTRYGNCARMANALIADETGTIKLCLWNEQIRCVSVGDNIQIQNARTSMFKGERQLNIGKNGLLSNITGSNCQEEAIVTPGVLATEDTASGE
jgi:replication factor A1